MIPGRGRVLLRRVESGESYPGGTIIIPETVRDAIMAQHAEVVAVGKAAICADDDCQRPHVLEGGWKRRPANGEWQNLKRTVHAIGVKAGDWVLVAKRAGVECGDETGKTYLVGVDDILAVLQA